MLKKCSKCGKEKNVKEFYADKKQSSGLYPSCKQCKTRNVKKYQNKIYEKLENIKIMTIKQKILNELKQNGTMNLKDLEKKYGKTTHLELIELVDDRLIGSTISINDGQTYYIKK